MTANLSPAVAALETAWASIQEVYPDLPAATIVVKRDKRAWGHTTLQHAWGPRAAGETDRIEIMVSGENLARGTVAVAGTLLHEAAHALNLARGILDTNNGYHSLKFAKVAGELGLTVKQAGWIGWSSTALSVDGILRWSHMLRQLDAGLRVAGAAHKKAAPAPVVVPPATGGATVVVPPTKGRKRSNLPKAVCPCGHSLRASMTVLELARPTCQACNQPFVVVD